jgi:hypothetical protein
MMTQGVLRMLRLCSGFAQHTHLGSGVLTLGSDKIGRCSRPQTKTELAEGKVNPESMGIIDLNNNDPIPVKVMLKYFSIQANITS